MKYILRNRRTLTAGAAAALMATTGAVISLVSNVAPAGATSNAADKMVVQGSNGIVLCTPNVAASSSVSGACNAGPMALLQGTIKLSTPKNLVVDVTLDCSTVTDVTTTTTSSGGTKNTSSAEAAAGVHAWLTLTPTGQQPKPTDPVIAVDPGGSTNSSQLNPGDVTFCNRDLFLSQSLTNNNAGAITLATTLNIQSQSANGFNWVSPADNNTTQVQTVTLWGETQNSTNTFGTSGSSAGAASWVGQRTMILTPANTAQNALF